jgi:hypothetical protein
MGGTATGLAGMIFLVKQVKTEYYENGTRKKSGGAKAGKEQGPI